MSRINMNPVSQFSQLLKTIEDDLREIKNKQLYSGLAGLLGYLATSNLIWDSTGTRTSGSVGLEIIFTGDPGQQFPVADLFLDVFFNGTAESNRPTEGYNGWYMWTDGTNTATVTNPRPKYDVNYAGNTYQYRWTYDFYVDGTITWYIKALVAGSSNGTITINRIY